MGLFDAYKLIKNKPQLRAVPHFFGGQYIQQNASASYITWVPSEDEIGPAKRSRQSRYAILNRGAGADIYIFGVSKVGTTKEDHHVATEALLEQVLAELQESFSGSILFERVKWGLRIQDQWLTFSGHCILPVFIDVPVNGPVVNAVEAEMEPLETEIEE